MRTWDGQGRSNEHACIERTGDAAHDSRAVEGGRWAAEEGPWRLYSTAAPGGRRPRAPIAPASDGTPETAVPRHRPLNWGARATGNKLGGCGGPQAAASHTRAVSAAQRESDAAGRRQNFRRQAATETSPEGEGKKAGQRRGETRGSDQHQLPLPGHMQEGARDGERSVVTRAHCYERVPTGRGCVDGGRTLPQTESQTSGTDETRAVQSRRARTPETVRREGVRLCLGHRRGGGGGGKQGGALDTTGQPRIRLACMTATSPPTPPLPDHPHPTRHPPPARDPPHPLRSSEAPMTGLRTPQLFQTSWESATSERDCRERRGLGRMRPHPSPERGRLSFISHSSPDMPVVYDRSCFVRPVAKVAFPWPWHDSPTSTPSAT